MTRGQFLTVNSYNTFPATCCAIPRLMLCMGSRFASLSAYVTARRGGVDRPRLLHNVPCRRHVDTFIIWKPWRRITGHALCCPTKTALEINVEAHLAFAMSFEFGVSLCNSSALKGGHRHGRLCIKQLPRLIHCRLDFHNDAQRLPLNEADFVGEPPAGSSTKHGFGKVKEGFIKTLHVCKLELVVPNASFTPMAALGLPWQDV